MDAWCRYIFIFYTYRLLNHDQDHNDQDHDQYDHHHDHQHHHQHCDQWHHQWKSKVCWIMEET